MSDNSSSSFTSCPSPLVLADDGFGIGGTPCTTPYRSLLWSASDWMDGDQLMVGCTVVSFICLTLVVVTWTVFPSKRRQHHLHMFMLCQFIVSLIFISTLAQTSSHPSTIGLPSFTSPTPSPSSPICVAQASLFVFFVNAAVFWWTFIAFHLFLKVVLHIRLSSTQQNQTTIVYHAVSWLVSLILTVIGGAKGWYGRSSVVPWCFFADDAPATADWLLFYVPIGIRGLVGMLMMGLVMHRLTRHNQLTSTLHRRTHCARNLRPLLFIFQFLVIFFFLILFRAMLYFHLSEYTTATIDYVQCLLMGGQCGDKMTGGPSVGLFRLIIVVTAGQGIVPGVIYLSQKETIDLWKGLFRGEGLGGVSQTGRGESSVNTNSRVGVAPSQRRMSGVGKGEIKSKLTISKGTLSSPLPPSHPIQPSPTLTSLPTPSPIPRHSLSSIPTHYQGPRTPDPTASQRWYDAHQYGGGFAVQMAEMGWREGGEGMGGGVRVEWMGVVRGGLEEPERGEWSGLGGGVGEWGGGVGGGLSGLEGVALGLEDERKAEEDDEEYRVELHLDE